MFHGKHSDPPVVDGGSLCYDRDMTTYIVIDWDTRTPFDHVTMVDEQLPVAGELLKINQTMYRILAWNEDEIYVRVSHRA